FGMLLAAVVLALAGIGLVFLYARRRLLERMQAVTSRLVAVASGDTGAPLRITGQDEIGRMEKALNVLRVRTIQALHLRAELESAIQTRTRELVDEMQAADDANRRKSEFLARMGHEIRTPLNGMIGMMELISGQPGADRQRLETALTSARDLLQITNDVLSFAASDAGGGAVAATDFRLRDLIGQVHAPLAALAAKKGLEVAVDLAESAPPFLLGDVVKIRQVLGNLTSNAVKYTAQGRVSLLIDHAAGPGGLHVISFTVADTGIGMTPEQAARVFDDFSRAEWARRSGIEGAGLGLAIARRLTEAMGGGLSVETAPGVGSRFTLTVPLHLGDPARITPAESEDQIARFCATVLVVEDHPVNRMVARGFLERLGCRVIEAETAAAALAEPGGFDLALVDLDLPDQPGQQVIAHLRQTCPRLPVAALTAHLLADDAATRAGLNVDAVLTKPVSPRALAEFLGRSLPPAGTAATDHPRIEEQTQDAGRAAVLAVLRADTEAIGRATVQALITAFLDDLPGAVEDVITGDAVARRRAAHRLKGAASNFGLAGLCDLLARAEAAPAELDPARLRASAASAETALRDAARAAGLTLTS
ncbi:MAG: ATP-binding protein, partial [Paracoccus sp. (in: a-proteobacteria)]|nr:ATP-binding protein [Paracoccus sp. (in: a-proteobacteria)]